MIKRILLLMLLVLSLDLYGQSIPESFKLGNFKQTVVKQTDKFVNSVTVTPNNRRCPISNFYTDIYRSGDTVWFATGSGIMRTRDNFNSFDNYLGLVPFGTDDIAGFYLKDNVIAVATAVTEEINSESIPVGTGIKVSTDYGSSWNSVPQPLDGLGDSSIVYGANVLYALPVVVAKQNLSYDIAITKTKNDLSNYTIWITSWAGGLRKSTDYGATWSRVLLPPDNLDSIYPGGTYTFALNPRNPPEGNNNHKCFSVKPLNDSTIIVGTANGINISSDWGISWRKYNFQNTGSGTNRVGGDFVVSLCVQRYGTKEIIWAASRKADDLNEVNSLSFSTNRGLTWAYTLEGYSPNGIFTKDSIVYGLTDAGIWRAKFGTFDWTKPSLIADPVTKDICKSNSFYAGNYIGDTLYIGSNDGLLRTRETGIAWSSPWKIYRASACLDAGSELKTYSAPNPFSPATEVTRIFYVTGKASSKVTIKIFDFGMNPVRTIIQNAVRTGANESFSIWDGKNDAGYVIANGVYFYRVEIDNDTPLWGKIILMQ
jgi:hypothetical protein